MQNELYADAIGEITVSGPTVRIDLVSLSATAKDSAGKPVPEFRQRVIMTIDGFANSFEVLQQAMNGLIEAGAIRRNVPEQRSPVVAGPGGHEHIDAPKPNGATSRLNGSPNFA